MQHIHENIKAIREEISKAANRPIELVAVTKNVSAEEVRQAVLAGVDAIGENRVQELLEKDIAGAYEGAPLHFIGRLQKNKISKILGKIELIHSIDSLELAAAVDAKAETLGIRQSILLQVNIGLEETKGGVHPDEVSKTAKGIAALKNLSFKGLMCIPPRGDISSFEKMNKLYGALAADFGFTHLSMGMSGDYLDAIAAGANIVRIGTGVFRNQ